MTAHQVTDLLAAVHVIAFCAVVRTGLAIFTFLRRD